jgi:hypothetical protein
MDDKRRGMPNRTAVVVFIILVLISHSLWYQFKLLSRSHPAGSANFANQTTGRAVGNRTSVTSSTRSDRNRCAVCLYGLPRAFDSLVLPSLIENVLKPNARHGCDYFVHYYNVTHEASGRSGAGGIIRPDDILHLAEAVDRVADESRQRTWIGRPVTRFSAESSEDFWRKHGALVEKVRTANDTKGRFLYFPWKEPTYQHPTTTDNILKMWHSIQQSWNLMESHAKKDGVEYSRVAMLRSDIFYLTRIDVWESPFGGRDSNNSHVVIPGFCRYPVSDRLIYGPSKAVKIWATERFDRMEAHVQWILHNKTGLGLHSETFVRWALLEPIKELGFRVEEHPTMCFFRARADETIWWTDCRQAALKSVRQPLGMFGTKRISRPVVQGVEKILRRKCQVGTQAASTEFHESLSCARDSGSGNSTSKNSGAESAT